MQIQISTHDGTPIYQQIVSQVKYLIAAGRLAPGEELPAIRLLAEQLTINPNTVARAYLELERASVVTKRHGSGTYVSETRQSLPRREKLKILTKRADTLLSDAVHLGISLPEVMDLLRDRHDVLQPETTP